MWNKSSMKQLLYASLILILIFIGCSKKGTTVTEPTNKIPDAAYIDLNGFQQIIRGFGGVNMPGWIDDMTPDMVNKAFGTGRGRIGLTILRIRVPYDETQFNLEVPTAQLAKSLGAIIIASPWTPPPYMKTNNDIVGGQLIEASYASYATHLKAFIDYMANDSAPLYAISVQNEPDANVDYESCYWTASQLLNFVKYYGPAVGNNLFVPESMDFNHSLSDPILNDPIAINNILFIGGHIYGGGLTSYPLAVSKGKEVWMTEHLVVNTNWQGAIGTALEMNDCMNAGMNAYVWWFIRRYYGPIDDNGNVTKRGFVMSQFARFIRPGYYKVDATASPQSDVYVTAYKSGSKIVIVAINDGYTVIDQQFILQNGTASVFTPYVTSSTKDCLRESDITVTGDSFTASLDSSSVTTFVSK